MSELQSSEAVKGKCQELCAEIAAATGVDAESVSKIMNYLNLENSLAYREYTSSLSEKFSLEQVSSQKLDNIRLNNLRIATGMIAL